MKKLALLLPFVLVAGFAVADEAKPVAPVAPAKAADAKSEVKSEKAPAKAAATKKVASTTHKVTGEVVSTDAAANSLTLKTATGEVTSPVEGAKAKAALKTVKAGDNVVVTCRDEKGEHKAVTAIVKAKAPAAAKSSK
jgi:hypothetical protein